jgi:hypothetical protein
VRYAVSGTSSFSRLFLFQMAEGGLRVRIQEEERDGDDTLADLSVAPPRPQVVSPPKLEQKPVEAPMELDEIHVSAGSGRRAGLPATPYPELYSAMSTRRSAGRLDTVAGPKLPPTIIVSEELVNWRDEYVRCFR